MPALQYWFTGGALAAFLAFTTLGYAWYRAAVAEHELAATKATSVIQRQKNVLVKNLLGKEIESGQDLLRDQSDKPDDQANKDAIAWGKKTHDLIEAAYGDGEATLFMSDAGYTFYTDSSTKTTIRNWIIGRLRRLSELIPRTDQLTVSDDFDRKFSGYAIPNP